jgi:hypothetical protein
MGLPVLGSFWGLRPARASAKLRRWRILITRSMPVAEPMIVMCIGSRLGGGWAARRGAIDFAVGDECF